MDNLCNVTTGKVRFSYVHLYKPYAYQQGQEEKQSRNSRQKRENAADAGADPMDNQLVDPEGYPAARQLQAQQVGEPTEQACQRFSQISFGNLKGEVKDPYKYYQKQGSPNSDSKRGDPPIRSCCKGSAEGFFVCAFSYKASVSWRVSPSAIPEIKFVLCTCEYTLRTFQFTFPPLNGIIITYEYMHCECKAAAF